MVATITKNEIANEHLFVHQMANDNFNSFEWLFNNYYEMLCQHAMQYMGEQTAAQDVVSDVFARIWEKRKQLQIETSVKSYLYRSVTNQCIDLLRKSYYKKTVLVDTFGQGETQCDLGGSYFSAETKELASAIELAIRQLPRQCGIIFRLSREAGMKYQEIATELCISVKTVETQMSRAFKALRVALLANENFLKVA
jgi:RNA polymerase sigma-70 factor, ECF subfamily